MDRQQTEDVCQRGEVRHSAARRGLYVDYVLNSTEAAPCSTFAAGAFAPERRMLNEGRQRTQSEKRSHLSIAQLEEEEKKG